MMTKWKQYQNWIFDWSGTLVDDMNLVVESTNYVMQQYGKPPFSRAAFKASFRLPYSDWYAEVLPSVDLEEIERHFRTGFKKSQAAVPVLIYAREFLELLAAEKKRLFVCSSMDALAFEQQAKQHDLWPYFEHTYAGVLDKRQCIDGMLKKHNLAKTETIFVGDMIHDIDTAHHGGISSLAVLTGYHTETELLSAKPTYTAKDFSSFLDQ